MSSRKTLALGWQNPPTALIDAFQTDGYVKVPQALHCETATIIKEAIDNQHSWNLVFNHQGSHQDLNALQVADWTEQQKKDLVNIVNAQASDGFQYFYENIPLYDIYYDNLLPEHFFNTIYEFLNSKETLTFFRELLNEPAISFVDAQITRFGPGHFLNVHNDAVANKNRIAAYVINLTHDWRPDWGGALHLLDSEQNIHKSFLPSFNEINIFKIPVDHYVGYVSPFASNKRISITGWLRSGENPKEKR
ncbi:2OG-Fe(II) oxygenase [Thalassotalea euphylliae]|uniref:2OG-Fe(II) oxygenase n=1 Tax=Thalassotalea euphylliae TaxID=1655234 RepID=UPI003645643C